ncbi:kynurenine formamidase [Neocloeon triangulifer]|uniref:kynurenine formamidase n=1 Tax=Neocloeon triangulifer TaxID=2078957 RepID=UPI00286EE742|nr:kynurenine formamidase [Neocloeon triangulifer]
MVDEELEKQYSPSRWSQRFGPKEVIEHHIKVVSSESEISKSTVPNEIGLRYGPREAQQYDLFGGDSLSQDAPLFVYIHGGYWQDLSRDISAYCVRPLARAGIRVAIMGYTLAPHVTLEEIVDEIRCGLQVIVDHAASTGCQTVWVGGHSAGAHLALSALLGPQSAGLQIVRGLVLISGIFDLTPLIKTTVNEPLRLDEQRASQLSPLVQLPNVRLPAWARRLHVLVAVGEHDSPAFIEQSKRLAEVLEGRLSSVELQQLKGLDHFDIVENLRSDNHVLTQRIKELIAASK